MKRDFRSDVPLKKCITNITEIKEKDGKLYVPAIFDCSDSKTLGLAMDSNIKASLRERTLTNAVMAYLDIKRA